MGAILELEDYCETETDGATEVTVVRQGMAHGLSLALE
jgi:hypothetical protein